MPKVIKVHIVEEGTPKTSLSRYLVDKTDLYPSRKSAYKAIRRGEVLVNGSQYGPGKWVYPGQKIEFIEPHYKEVVYYNHKIHVIYEDKQIAVVEKPPGVRVNGNYFKTLERMLPVNLYASNESNALAAPRPVHRLDAATGGLVLVAKTSLAHIDLSDQFESQTIIKKYKAIVIGELQGKGEIREPIDSKDAHTKYSAIKTVPSLKNGALTLVDLYPKTGRTHQLRKHMAFLGTPILGDKLYGIEGQILKSKGLFLWAIEIGFRHPETGMFMNISIDPPQKFQTILKREERRWEQYN